MLYIKNFDRTAIEVFSLFSFSFVSVCAVQMMSFLALLLVLLTITDFGSPVRVKSLIQFEFIIE